jgi:hypothetical protein
MATTSQPARKLITLLGQMKDAERGKRIKGLREGKNPERKRPKPIDRRISQPKMIREIEDMAGLGHFVSLRGLQYWEDTGGIDPEKCDLIAEYFGVDPRWLFYGPERTAPDLTAVLNANDSGPTEGDVEVLARLEQLDRKLDILLSGLRLIPTADGKNLLDQATDALQQEPPEPPPDEEDEEPGQTGSG